jgi:hypothetical protein
MIGLSIFAVFAVIMLHGVWSWLYHEIWNFIGFFRKSKRSPLERKYDKLKARHDRMAVQLASARKMAQHFRQNEVKALLDINELCNIIEQANMLVEKCDEAMGYWPIQWQDLKAMLREAKETHCHIVEDENGGEL